MSEQSTSQKNIEALLPDAFEVLHEALTDPEIKMSDRLRATQILGKWAGLEKGYVPVTEPGETLESVLASLSKN